MKPVQTGNQRGSEHSKWAWCTITNSITAWNKACETRDVNGTGTPPHCATLRGSGPDVPGLTGSRQDVMSLLWSQSLQPIKQDRDSQQLQATPSCPLRPALQVRSDRVTLYEELAVSTCRVTWLHDQLQITKSWVTALIQCLSQWHVLLLKPCGRGLYPGQVTPLTSLDCERKPRQGEHEAPTAAPLSHHNLIMLFKVSLWSCLKLKAFVQKAHMLSSSSYTN